VALDLRVAVASPQRRVLRGCVHQAGQLDRSLLPESENKAHQVSVARQAVQNHLGRFVVPPGSPGGHNLGQAGLLGTGGSLADFGVLRRGCRGRSFIGLYVVGRTKTFCLQEVADNFTGSLHVVTTGCTNPWLCSKSYGMPGCFPNVPTWRGSLMANGR
jgi:hypothetical protein